MENNYFEKLKNGEIKCEVLCHNRPFLREDDLEYKYMMCYGLLIKMFDTMEKDESIKNIELYFPERYINILEQRALLNRIFYYFPNIKNIRIETHSPFILQTVPATCAGIIKYHNQVKETTDPEVKLYNTDFVYE